MENVMVRLLSDPEEPQPNIGTHFISSNPEIICIYGGSCINQILLRALTDVDDLVDGYWFEHHDQHWHHERRSSLIDYKEAVSLVKDFSAKQTRQVVIVSGLHIREEKEGLLVGKANAAFLINKVGALLFKHFQSGKPFSVADFISVCDKKGISKREGMAFLEKLIIFGIARKSYAEA